MNRVLTAPERLLDDPPGGSHVCWVFDDDAQFAAGAETMLRNAVRSKEKPVVFGPTGSAELDRLTPFAAVAVDPHVAVLEGRPIEPEAMFAAFRRETAVARDEGYARLRVVADMDWLLPTGASAPTIQAFELMLDRQARELDATIVCAYRASSFEPATTRAAACVHPVAVGGAEPRFRMVAGDGCWNVSGEVDVAVDDDFAVALQAAAAADKPCAFDVSRLDFIDVRGMTQLGQLTHTTRVHLRGASPALRRHLHLACTAEEVGGIDFVD